MLTVINAAKIVDIFRYCRIFAAMYATGWSPITATYEDLLDLFKYMHLEQMRHLLDIAIDMEEYLYADKLTRIIEHKRLHPESILPLDIKFHSWEELL